METQKSKIISSGAAIESAEYALIMIHGRGASADGILSLSTHFNLQQTAVFAPQAPFGSWYPESFMAPVQSNQPDLDEGLQIIEELVSKINSSGIPNSKIAFCGFSQGACLVLEYTSRHADQYAGIVAFTGGLIGKEIELQNYKGDFKQTPVLLTTGDPDHHVPLQRVKDSARIIEGMQGKISLHAYPGKPHNITLEEIKLANNIVFDVLAR
jgi:phospholipase/carboxylesterase